MSDFLCIGTVELEEQSFSLSIIKQIQISWVKCLFCQIISTELLHFIFSGITVYMYENLRQGPKKTDESTLQLKSDSLLL